MRNTTLKNQSRRLHGHAKVNIKNAIFSKKNLPSTQSSRDKNLPT